MRLDVLGPLQLWLDGVEITPASAIARRLLCLLACRAPGTASIGELVETAWPDGTAPKDPEQNLQTHVARIRRLGGAAAGDPGFVETQAGGYRLRAGALALDLDVLSELTAVGLGADHDPGALRRQSDALALWRGPSLADIAETDAGRGDAARLDELRLSISEARFESLLGAGERAALVHDVEAFTVDHPYRERPYAVLMRALNDLGRHADALAAYQRLRTRLADDLGLEPSPALRELEADVLGHRLPVHAPTGSGPTPGPFAPPPAPLTALVGRDGVLDALDRSLDRSRLVTVVGAGGVGKTRLVLELAHRRRSDPPEASVLWCDLSSAGSETEVVDLLASSVRARQQPDESRRDAAVRGVADAEPILVLDNCEQVIEPTAKLVTEVLGASGRTRVVATSRMPFDVPGEVVIRLEPLRVEPRREEGGSASGPAPAVELLVARAAEVGVDLLGSDPTLAQAAHICRAVDGLPLGIELAAAQLRNMSPTQLARRLDVDLGPLEVGRRTGPAWHRSIGATLEWSYRLLTPEEQRLLAEVSTFSGAFDARSAARLTRRDDPIAVEDRLRTLADLSLLTVTPDAADLRFRLLGTTRRFGRRTLAEDGREAELSAGHRDWVRDLVGERQEHLRGSDEAGAAHDLDAATDDVRAAVTRATSDGDADTALGICSALGEFAMQRLRDDIVGWTERALTMATAPGHPLEGRALANLARGLTSRGELDRAESCAQQALRSAAHDATAVVAAQHALALVALYSGRLDDTVSAATTQLTRAEADGDDVDAQTACLLCALACFYGGDTDAALDWAERSLRFADRSGQPSARAWAQYASGEVLAQRDPERAADHLEAAVATGASVGNLFVVGVAEVSLAGLRSTASDPTVALASYGRLIRHWDETNDWTHQRTTLQNVAPLLARTGAAADAAVLVGALTRAAEQPLFGTAADDIAELEVSLASELGARRFEELQARGADLSRREVITLATRLTDGAGPVHRSS